MKTLYALTAILMMTISICPETEAASAELGENRVAVVIDASGSYKSKMQDAIGSAAVLLEQMSNVSFKRWEPARDRIVLISMDSMPEVIWSGSLQDLKTLDKEHWKSAFEVRGEYAQCTDVVKGIRLAVRELNRDAGAKTNKYMFIYSDLVHEPPMNSINDCAPINTANPVPVDMPWEDLKDISIVTLWIPIDQKFVWTKAVEEFFLQDTFKLYASESEVREILPPPRPTILPTEEESKEAREQVMQGLSFAGKAVAVLIIATVTLVLLILFFLAIFFVWVRFVRNPRRLTHRHGPGNPRMPIRRTIPSQHPVQRR